MQAPTRSLWTQCASPVLVLGPAYAGKSELAMQTLRPDRQAIVLGTAPPDEPFFSSRLAHLQSLRPADWTNIHPGEQLISALREAVHKKPAGQFLIDAINQWLAVLLLGDMGALTGDSQRAALLDQQITDLIKILGATAAARFVLVSAEVGAGPAPARVPERLYRQAVGITNQRLAGVAKTVVTVQAGIGTVIKS